MPDRKLDIIIPVYNEGKNISSVLDALAREVQTPFRVLVCYDFDEDDTLNVLARYPREKIDFITVKNHGNGVHGAIMSGFQASDSPAVIVLPADDDYNAGRIDHMVSLLLEGCDIVSASRFLPGGKMVGCPWLKAVLARTASFTLFFLQDSPVTMPPMDFVFSHGVLWMS
ncbi:MAG: glycosyltransferase family 2 protein [Nitrospinaceae bacterium]|jgi:glycosyltransferase involved in cell wall biosynthesis|nr:glycosyltransferase family 2 protein [Nitrospinaceae bacterium]|tara:strand:- start:452 stop:961 length:510 start_codon:yes stop_codon:yes gene_type:complete